LQQNGDLQSLSDGKKDCKYQSLLSKMIGAKWQFKSFFPPDNNRRYSILIFKMSGAKWQFPIIV
jgi:hypothetical protein